MIRGLLILILLLLVARAFWKVMDSVIAAAGGGQRPAKGRAPSVRLVRDPVCGTHVAPNASLSLSAGGTTHYFCSEKCRAEYRKR